MGRDLLLQQLKTLQRIGPDTDFLRRSRDLILLNSQRPASLFRARTILIDGLQWSLALGLMSFLLFIVIGGFNPRHNNLLASLNEKALLKESASVIFNLELDEVRYREQIEKNIAIVIDEIINN